MKFSAKALTAVLLIVLGGTIVLRERSESIQAADTETVTWGATDPTWSPDGVWLAFSLFGTIWKVPSSGGRAAQITNGPGYHAHPAWSPKGDQVAFISGQAPRGRIPNIPGKLFITEVATGHTREINTPYPTAGNPAWSPDGTRLVCGLDVPQRGSLLHEINVETGDVRQLQHRPRRAEAERWIDASWGSQGEIFFTARRGGPTQVWSMPAGDPPFLVQLPLTRYRDEDIALLHTLSPIGDGSEIVYSAAVVNGRGNYELYRVAAEGGGPAAITDTPRDEFSPAVSPDGLTIAHVSNHLGNIDLFTMPVAGGEKKHVRLTELGFRNPSGRLRVTIQDELGRPAAARLYVQASDGRAYCPAGSSIYYYPLDPGGEREGFFVAGGDDTFPAPAGRVRLVALKGVEYRIAERSVEVAPDKTTEVTIVMERWTNWSRRGWYTGDNHFHANYNGSYYQRPLQSLAWLKAVDLNTANMVVANSEGAFVHDKEFFRGGIDPLSEDNRILYWGQEYRNSNPLGHMGFLNIKTLVSPFYSSVVGSDSPYDFPLNTMTAIEARKQGGLVTYMHSMTGAANDVFDGGFSAREVPVTAALGALDSVDILPLFGGNPDELWYRLLNAGFQIAPGAGTDTFTNYRGITRLPGMVREYVEVGPVLKWDRWIARYREGRNFVTNGPLLTFEVNGQPMGSEIRVAPGEPYRALLQADVAANVPLHKIELIQNGRIVESREVEAGLRSVRVEKEVMVEQSCWFAVRVSGKPARGVPDDGIPRAHSGPIYIHVGGKPTLLRSDVELMLRWVERLWSHLLQRDNFGSQANRKRAEEMFERARAHYREKLSQAQ